MGKKPQKIRCGELTAAGRPCRAWSVQGTDPPQCSAHAGLNVGAGAPEGNQNALDHGFYGRVLKMEEAVDLLTFSVDGSLADEIALSRVALRRVMKRLEDDLSVEEFAHLSGLIFQGSRAVAAMVRSDRVLRGDAADGLADALGKVLTEIGEEMGRPL